MQLGKRRFTRLFLKQIRAARQNAKIFEIKQLFSMGVFAADLHGCLTDMRRLDPPQKVATKRTTQL
jgi:hypothetical protein